MGTRLRCPVYAWRDHWAPQKQYQPLYRVFWGIDKTIRWSGAYASSNFRFILGGTPQTVRSFKIDAIWKDREYLYRVLQSISENSSNSLPFLKEKFLIKESLLDSSLLGFVRSLQLSKDYPLGVDTYRLL